MGPGPISAPPGLDDAAPLSAPCDKLGPTAVTAWYHPYTNHHAQGTPPPLAAATQHSYLLMCGGYGMACTSNPLRGPNSRCSAANVASFISSGPCQATSTGRLHPSVSLNTCTHQHVHVHVHSITGEQNRVLLKQHRRYVPLCSKHCIVSAQQTSCLKRYHLTLSCTASCVSSSRPPATTSMPRLQLVLLLLPPLLLVVVVLLLLLPCRSSVVADVSCAAPLVAKRPELFIGPQRRPCCSCSCCPCSSCRCRCCC